MEPYKLEDSPGQHQPYLRHTFYRGGLPRNNYDCHRCHREFVDEIAKLQHLRDSWRHNECCNEDFETFSELQNHFTISPNHSYCAGCNEHFEERGRGQVYWDHITNSPSHHFCRGCQLELTTIEELNEHLEIIHSCCIRCEKECGSEEKLEVHRQTSERHWICLQCFRDFPIENQLLRHQKVHLPRNIICSRCEIGFCSISALIIHWENGNCFGSRQLLNEKVCQFDIKGYIIPIALRQAVSRNPREGNESNWNGVVNKWECGLCTRYFESLTRLNQHLASPFHDVAVFECLGCALGGIEYRFTTLSGLMQHVEDTGCGHGGKGEKARRLMDFLSSAIPR